MKDTGVTVNALHPGLVRTNIARNNGPLGRVVNLFIGARGVNAERGRGDDDPPCLVTGSGEHDGQVFRELPPRPVFPDELRHRPRRRTVGDE